jgi:putative Mn2+ efflux pump MntP
MTLIAFFILALALSADAFTASLVRGVTLLKGQYEPIGMDQLAVHALIFGGMEGGMLTMGVLAGDLIASQVVSSVITQIGAGILLLIGGRMIWSSIAGHDADPHPVADKPGFQYQYTAILAFGTSIDSVVTGSSLGLLGTSWVLGFLVAGVTSLIAFLALRLGDMAGVKWGKYASLAGGLVLCAFAVFLLVSRII